MGSGGIEPPASCVTSSFPLLQAFLEKLCEAGVMPISTAYVCVLDHKPYHYAHFLFD